MKIVLALALLFSVNSFANNWYDRGNGGFVLQCEGQKPQVLDLYEATTRFNLPVVSATATTTAEKAKELISRLAGKDPRRAELLNNWLANFFNEQQMVAGSFAKTPDLGAVIIPDGCELQQVIVQQQPSVVNAFRYLINAKLWNQLDTDNQAALIVHELIYREFISTPSQEFSSERIRYFNAFVHANLPGIQTLNDYVTKLQEVHIGRYQYHDFMLFLGAANGLGEWIKSDVSFDENDRIIGASLSSHQVINKPYLKYACLNNDVSPNLGLALLSSEGTLTKFEADASFHSSFDCRLPYFNYNLGNDSFVVSGDKWTFDKNEQPLEVTGAAPTEQNQISYKGNIFVSANSLSSYSAPDKVFRFDSQMNLIEIGLGGVPCRIPNANAINFVPDAAKWNTSVMMDASGKATSTIHSCY